MIAGPIVVALLMPPSMVRADDPPVERRQMLTGFDRVRIDGPFVVTIASGVAPAARISGNPRSIDRVRIRVDGTTLAVTPVRPAAGEVADPGPLPAIALATGRIAALTVRGGGRVTVDRLAGAQVDLSLTGDGAIAVAAVDADRLLATSVGAGRMRIAGRSAQARFAVDGAADIDAAALVVDTLAVVGSGTGSGRYHARYVADVTAAGTGSVVVTGNPQCHVRGRATIRCGDRSQSPSGNAR